MPLLSAQGRSLLLCPFRQRFCGTGRKWGCEPGLGYALPMCYFGPGYEVKLAW